MSAFALAALTELQRELVAAIQHGQVNRAAELVTDFESEYPVASQIIRAMFSGTAEQVVDKLSAYWPGVKSVPGAVQFVASLQEKLMEVWNRKRGARVVPEGKRLKA
jgi:hypothetical protein